MNPSKILVITRPSGLQLVKRNFNFSQQSGADLRSLDTAQAGQALTRLVGIYDESWTMDSAIATLQFCECGAQLCVASELSKDLEASSICGDLASIAWPAVALHVVFEDESLPSFIAQKRMVFVSGGGNEEGVCLTFSMKDGSHAGIVIGNSEWRSYCEGAEIVSPPRKPWEGDINDTETMAIRYMAALFAKVLAYASVPRFAPVKLSNHSEKKAAGIHPNQHVDKPTLLLRHLPRVIKDTDVTPASGSIGDAHRFMGRAGHLRHYQSERYKAMRGQWQWIPPIPPPEGIKVVYKVRKVAV